MFPEKFVQFLENMQLPNAGAVSTASNTALPQLRQEGEANEDNFTAQTELLQNSGGPESQAWCLRRPMHGVCGAGAGAAGAGGRGDKLTPRPQANQFDRRQNAARRRLSSTAGAVFAASNAALALAQLGREGEATKEMQGIARRAPGSADMRAALAALYWSQVWSTDGSG